MIAMMLVFLICGCSGSNHHSDPITPSGQEIDSGLALSENTAYPSNRYMLGLWNFHVDPASQTVTGSQMRVADMHLNLVKLIEVACTDCLTFSNADFSIPGQLSIDMTIKHPFQDELIFTVFDLRGVFITDRAETWNKVYAWGDDSPVLLNSDGYTWLFSEKNYPYNPEEPAVFNYYPGVFSYGDNRSAQLNAYVAYGIENPRRMLLPGTDETRTLTITLPGVPFDFGYVVDACWELPLVNPVTDPVDDFPITANCYEAYKLIVNIGEGLTTDTGSKALIEVEVFDHQGFDTIEFNNNEGELIPVIFAEIYADSTGDISYVSPYTDNHFDFIKETDEGGFLFKTVMEIEKLYVEEGIYPLRISVWDKYEDPNLETRTASMIIPLFIPADVNALPVAGAMAYPVPQTVGKPVQFRNDGSYDPDGGGITKYEWDWDMDGTYDDEGSPIYHTFDTAGLHYVDLKVTDNEGTSRSLFKPLEITIKEGEGWARTWGSSWSDEAQCVEADSSGNIYVAGYYGGNTDFDPGPQDAYRSGYGDSDTFLSKFDSDGNFKWVRTMGGLHGDHPKSLRIDSFGNILLAGGFSSDITFEGDPAHQVFPGYSDIFLCSYGPAGVFKWAKTWGEPDSESVREMSFDSTGNIYLGGYFEGTSDFDPGPGEELRTSHYESDAFLEKLSPTGEFIWVAAWGTEPDGSDYHNWVWDVDLDSLDDVYCVGTFEGTVDFDPGSGVDLHSVYSGSYNSDAFMCKLTSGGEYQWVRTWGNDRIDRAFCLEIDSIDRISVAGCFNETVDFDPGPGEFELTSIDPNGGGSLYLSRFNQAGDFEWAIKCDVREDYNNLGLDMALDDWDNIFITGLFYPSGDFDPGPVVVERFTNGSKDYFLMKLNATGEFQWVGTWGGPHNDGYGRGVAVDSLGYASVIGGYYESADFDPGPGEDWHYGAVIENPQQEAFVTHFPPDGNW